MDDRAETLDNARKIMTIYAHIKGGPSQVLISNNFLAVAKSRRWDPFDLQDGLEKARQIGWIEKADRGWRLTEIGFEEAERAR